MTLPSGAMTSFKYDPFGRRIEKIGPSGTTIYVYDGDNVIEQLDGGGNVTVNFTQGLGIDEPLAMYANGGSYYYQADGLGSITSLSDTTGKAPQTYTYDSFGNLTASTGSVANPFQYTAREFDSETGLAYYRARYYDPVVGRLISEDPTRFGAGANFYAYVGNSPPNLSDPLGLCADEKDTAKCLRRGLQALFPGIVASVGAPIGEVGGHWNFNVQLQFASYAPAMGFYNSYSMAGRNGFGPPARFGNGPTVHLENLSPTNAWLNSNGTYTVNGTAHIDLFNPNNADLESVGGHVGVDGLIGHLVQALGGNIDPAHCPW